MDISDIARGFEEAEQTAEFTYERLMVDIREEIAKAMHFQDMAKQEVAKRSGLTVRFMNELLDDDPRWVRDMGDVIHVLHAVGLKLKVVPR